MAMSKGLRVFFRNAAKLIRNGPSSAPWQRASRHWRSGKSPALHLEELEDRTLPQAAAVPSWYARVPCPRLCVGMERLTW